MSQVRQAAHCMIDLETMGNGSCAAIVSIGAVKFNPFDPDTLPAPDVDRAHQFYCLVDLKSSMDLGMVVDASTIYWWLEQDTAAQQALIPKKNLKVPVFTAREALFHLFQWYQQEPRPSRLWSHATFDSVILNNAYRLSGKGAPWNYKDCIDLRTLVKLFWEDTDPYVNPSKHHALYDAWCQANQVKHLYQKVGVINE